MLDVIEMLKGGAQFIDSCLRINNSFNESEMKACAMSNHQCDKVKRMRNRSLQLNKTKFTKCVD